MADLLSRLAENAFWAARYVERVENLARLLQVSDTEGRDSLGRVEWTHIVDINGDRATFAERGLAPNRSTVCRYYLFDASNPTSALNALANARTNIRALRHLVNTELWRQINVFYNDFRNAGEDRFATEGLSALCASMKFNAQAIYGIVDGTQYRDDAYLFYGIGRYVELADQTTRLLDAALRFIELARPSDAEARGHWQAVLRSAGAHQAFKRARLRQLDRRDVCAFLLTGRAYPRSVSFALRELIEQFGQMRSAFGIRPDPEAMAILDLLRAMIDEIDPGGDALRDRLDATQKALIDFTERTSQAYFVG